MAVHKEDSFQCLFVDVKDFRPFSGCYSPQILLKKDVLKNVLIDDPNRVTRNTDWS